RTSLKLVVYLQDRFHLMTYVLDVRQTGQRTRLRIPSEVCAQPEMALRLVCVKRYRTLPCLDAFAIRLVALVFIRRMGAKIVIKLGQPPCNVVASRILQLGLPQQR